MDTPTKSREYLTGKFKKNAIPTETDFRDLIEAPLNQKDDGVAKRPGEPLSVEAAPTGNMPVLRLYESFSDAIPDWALCLQDAGGTRKLVVADGGGQVRLSIDHVTGEMKVGVLVASDLRAGALAVSTLGATGLITASGGLTVPAGKTTSVDALNAGALKAKGTSVEALSATGLITASGGLTVPAGKAVAVGGKDPRNVLDVQAGDRTGTHAAGAPLYVTGALDPAKGIEFRHSNGTQGIGFGSNTIYATGTSADQHLRLAAMPLGQVRAVGGIAIEGTREHMDVDGAFYRHKDAQVYITVDDNLYVRRAGAASAAFHFNTVNGYLGVGRVNPSYTLDVEGSMRATQGLRVSNGITFDGRVQSADGMVEIDIRPHASAQNVQYAVLHVKGLVLTNHVRASGKVTCNELVATSGAKQFQIDHPLDPRRRRLVHACVEGPEAAVYYRGEGQLAGGRAVVALPAYFEALTRKEGRTVMITPRCDDDGPVSALAASGIVDGQCTVRAIDSRNPSQRFYWEVKAVRADLPLLETEPAKNHPRAAPTPEAAPADLDAE